MKLLIAIMMLGSLLSGNGCLPEPVPPKGPVPPGCKDLVWTCVCNERGECKRVWVCKPTTGEIPVMKGNQ